MVFMSNMKTKLKTKHFVKLIVGALYSDLNLLELAKQQMKDQDWIVQNQSKEFPFDKTDYYAQEMGSELKRCFLSIKGLQGLDSNVSWKLITLGIEKKLSNNGKSRVNLDPGYIDFTKIVLLSVKEGPQKIYLRDGIWADLVLLKDKSGFRKFNWTFPDQKQGYYNDFFLQVREKYKLEISQKRELSNM